LFDGGQKKYYENDKILQKITDILQTCTIMQKEGKDKLTSY